MAKKVKNPKVPRTRNGGTLTESQFWGAIRSALRARFSRWRPAYAALKLARRRATAASGPGKHKFEYLCAICGKWFRAEDVQADHVEPAGSLRKPEDLAGFIERLTPEDPAAFQCVCKGCHKAKTREDVREMKEQRNGQRQWKLPW